MLESLPFAASGEAATMLAITSVCIALWITTPVPPSYTGLLCIGMVGLFVSSEVAFSGFTSPAVWLIVFGLVVGEATRESGLATWLGRTVTRSVPDRARGDSVSTYRWLLGVLCLAALALTFLIPSSLVRVLLLLPVLDRIGRFFDSRSARTGIVLGPALTTFFASVGVLTASLPNVITTGIVEAAGGPSISWTRWATFLFPVMGLGRAAVVAGVAYALYRPSPDTAVHVDAVAADGGEDADAGGTSAEDEAGFGDGTTGDERRMLAFLLVGTAVWATDFLHGLHPVYGALLVAALATLPRVGVLSFDGVGDVDFTIVFFLGAVFAIGEGLRRSGFVETAAQTLLGSLPQSSGLWLLLLLVFGVTLLLMFLIEGLVVASVLTPLLVSYSQAAGVPLAPVVMIEATALSVYFFPYQSAVLVGILAEDVVETREVIRCAVACSLATMAILLPVQILLFVAVF